MVTSTSAALLKRLRNSKILGKDKLAAMGAVAGAKTEALIEYLVQQGHLTDFQVRQLRAGVTSFHIGDYVITDCLGRGGNGIVFKARHTATERVVAIKTIDSRNLHHADEAQARFKREATILSQLDHPNVIRALDVLATRTHTFLVLEFVRGQDLGAVVKEQGRLPIKLAIRYALQTARGLQYIHSQGIVHRDIKPANLLLTMDGVVKLSDLGLAKFFKSVHDSDLTTKGLCVGTPEYMAPEQAEDAHSANPQSDIFSLGSTLFHLLTGELPVKGQSYLHRLKQLLASPPIPLMEARPDAPPELATIVDCMREKDPDARPESAAEVIRMLEAC